MKYLLILASVIAFTGCQEKQPKKDASVDHKSHDPHAGHAIAIAPSVLIVDTEPAEVSAGHPAKLKLMIHGADGRMVKDFDEVHEKRVHLIIVRDGLDHFAHIHPDIDGDGNINATFSFPVPGRYHLYADHKPRGKSQTVAQAIIDIAGVKQEAPELRTNVPGSVTGDGLNAQIDVVNAKAENEATITFHLRDKNAREVTDLEPYLGAMGHLVVLSADGSRYVHAHPEEASEAANSTVTFAAHFMKSGIYKGWGQFQRAGTVHTVPFVIKVD